MGNPNEVDLKVNQIWYATCDYKLPNEIVKN